MPTPIASQIADALTTHVNAGSYSESVSATRKAVHRVDVSALSSAVVVAVVPLGEELAQSARGVHDIDYVIGIAVDKRVDPDNAADVDAAAVVAEEIRHHVAGANVLLVDGEYASLRGLEVNPLLNTQRLIEDRLFSTIIRATYRKELET